MHRASKFLLFLVALVAVLALAVGPASATEPIEGVTANHAHCPSLAAGGCPAHAEGEATLFFHIFGIESTELTCRVEFEMRIGGNGEGYITSQTITPHPNDAACDNNTMEPCSEPEHPNATEFPWHFFSEEIDGGVVKTHADMCIEPFEVVSECQGEFVYRVHEEENEPSPGMETQHWEATDLRVGASSLCELSVDMESEVDATHQSLHLRPAV